MNNKKLLIAAFTLTAMGLASLTSSSFAAEAEKEKCMGLAKAGMGDGKVTIDGKVEEWLYVPAGACAKFVDGRLLLDKK
ncbi:MAG: DUF2282 domain-containing protein [Thiotrichaceae bacterium]|nr:DUF2282 domain-containing protein [Thiotrichaceae bacterium]